MVNEKKIEKTFINDYMAWSLHDRDVRKRGIEEGIKQGISQGLAQGIARQKAEDSKLLSLKDAEIERLKAMLSTQMK